MISMPPFNHPTEKIVVFSIYHICIKIKNRLKLAQSTLIWVSQGPVGQMYSSKGVTILDQYKNSVNSNEF